ncbi:multi-component regulatory system-8 [Streptomyces griseocarneus]|nr:multi-component regulatory system-8 [Streptomyces griseocarneus]
MSQAVLCRKPARVRPYSLTGGRPRRCRVLLVETFVAAPEPAPGPAPDPREARGPAPRACADRGVPEARAIVDLCFRLRSVAEIAALLKMPLGMVRVLLLELADQGRIRVFDTGHGTGRPDRALLERVLGGLHRL